MTFHADQAPLQPPTPTFPTNHVVGIVKDLQEAEQALHALRKAGHAEDRIHLIQSQEVVEGMEGRLQHLSCVPPQVLWPLVDYQFSLVGGALRNV